MKTSHACLGVHSDGADARCDIFRRGGVHWYKSINGPASNISRVSNLAEAPAVNAHICILNAPKSLTGASLARFFFF